MFIFVLYGIIGLNYN